MTEPRRDSWLLTPGPLTTSRTVKEAMLHDWGSRDAEFIKLNARIRERLVDLAGGQGTHVCVPLQGSGTFVVEAMIGTLVPRTGKLAVLVNGAYGARMVRMCEYLRRERVVLDPRKVRERWPPRGLVRIALMDTPRAIQRDLLLEQRRDDNGGAPAIFKPLDGIEIKAKR